MKQVLAFLSGIFVVEFHWTNKDTDDCSYHVLAVNYNQRRVFCNILDVILFATENKNESETTHATVCKHLHNHRAYRAYCIIQCRSFCWDPIRIAAIIHSTMSSFITDSD